MHRFLEYSFSIWYSGNSTGNATEFDANLKPAEDVSVDTVVASLYFNTVVFVLLMAFYECLRRLLPAVYSSRKRLSHMHARDEESIGRCDTGDSEGSGRRQYIPPTPTGSSHSLGEEDRDHSYSISSLPDNLPFDWLAPVFGVPWAKVRKTAGLDGYFFLRYIRMNIRITAVSTFWFFLILVPIYATGDGGKYPSEGWYHLSAANLSSQGWRMWAPCIFAYFFSAFIFFVIKQEYRHFLELRQDYLARGSAHVNPQHHYSLIVEDIPYDLRSRVALAAYFESLFPGRVHSASVVLKLPDLEEASIRCTRICRRLEKSIAYLQATGKRPTHINGRGRLRVLGVDLNPIDCLGSQDQEAVLFDDDHLAEQPFERPERGARVDSISYYTQDLAAKSRALFRLQKQKESIADTGNFAMRAENWFDKVFLEVTAVADRIMDDSVYDNDLICPSESVDSSLRLPQAEHMTSRYGSISPIVLPDPAVRSGSNTPVTGHGERTDRLVSEVQTVGYVGCLRF
jgi:hypothetical protein